ncbi:hypothetical protein ACDW_22970 [Acidovorax sp. DW039]|uniref:hypothetical protein n=1 Tax=Acidovorax sp. DW039 TaxID=3095606 RepID=UPI00308DB0B1|nr:hypothetical protein ACDW_22970 [Acidovorax sp. DW039]
MDTAAIEKLAGRIEGMSRAVLHIAAALEDKGLIDGVALSAAWRSAVPPVQRLFVAGQTLEQLAWALDDARMHRQAHTH